jgi:hypothetical protein
VLSVFFVVHNIYMAHLIPETLNNLPNVTSGEASLFRLLQQKLDDRSYVWFNIPIRRRHADFVILNPELGLLILEVKDWQLSRMRVVSPTHIVLDTDQGEKMMEHPLRQARDYALRIADILASDQMLIQKNGPYSGQLIFPFSFGVVWTKIREENFRRELPELFDRSQMLFRESISPSISVERFNERLKSLFPQQFSFKLSTEQINRIRYHIFPEVRLPRKQFAVLSSRDEEQPLLPGTAPTSDNILTVMDLEQERLAKNLGEGHRLLRGVAGSGKTWTLICRARILAELHPNWKILVLCYNVSLAAMLRQMIDSVELPRRSGNIRVANFHMFLTDLARSANMPQSSSSTWAQNVSQTLVQLAAEGRWSPPTYDAVLIDEAHDFHSEWLRLAISCLNPQTNSLFVVHDSAQNIYRKGFSFKKVGIQIKGRTRVLRTNYRNTREIADLASCFLSYGVKFAEADLMRDDEGQLLEIIRPQTTLRTGPAPLLIGCESYREECAETAARVKRWLEKNEYPPQEILILYVKRGATPTDDRYVRALLTALEEAGVEYEWITRDQQSKRKFLLSSPKVKVSTIHSAKGLDFGVVAIVGISMLPSSSERADMERKLIYVGLTRARHTLLITHCKDSQFILELKSCIGSK